jgi:phage gp16-like protein
MPRPTPLIGNKEKALIHVAKSRLGLSDEDYRAVLASVGAASSRDLNHVQFDELMERFKACGFVNGGRKAADGKRKSRPKPADGRAPLLRKIAAILADTGLPAEYADGMAQKMFGVDAYGWLNSEQLWKIAAALSIFVKRKAKKTGGENGGSHTKTNRAAGAHKASAPRRDAGA